MSVDLPPLNLPELLRQHGLRPDKRLGQNYLVDHDMLNEVVACAQLQPEDAVLEIGAGPGNLTHDVSEARLAWAEYGCVPYFELTYTGAEQMMETSYNRLYSSAFEEWLPTAKAVYQEYRESFAPLATSFMVGHERIDGNVVKVTYDNGTAVYVNYGTADWAKGGVRVRARDYAIVHRQEGGNGP